MEADKLNIKGMFRLQHWRDGRLLGVYDVPNTITTEGKNKLWDVMFHAATQITTWYLGLISSVGYTATAVGDTYEEIGGSNGWTEFTTYTDTDNAASAVTRPAWPEDAAAAGAITNTTVANFKATSAGTVKGFFLCGGAEAQTKGDATAGNTLWCATVFSNGDAPVAINDDLKLVYSASA